MQVIVDYTHVHVLIGTCTLVCTYAHVATYVCMQQN